MSRLDVVLILGCYGHQDKDNFIFCNGTQNIILELNKVEQEKYNSLINFFEKACGLFQSAISDYNKCFNVLNLLYKEHKIIKTEEINKIQQYLIMHKLCCPYLILTLREDTDV